MSYGFTTLSKFLQNVIANQMRNTLSAQENKTALVTNLAVTSVAMNINPKTGTITIVTSTGTSVVPQPTINPIPVNTPTAYLSTSSGTIAVTAGGQTDTILVNELISISEIVDVTNAGYTNDASPNNLKNPEFSKVWNPQVNLGAANPFFYKLVYNFANVSSIYKFSIKSLYSQPGFTEIKLYPTTTPTNYVTFTPFTDTNEQYVDQTIQLLVDNNGNPLFQTNSITAEYTLGPTIQPNTSYQYGSAYGVCYGGETPLDPLAPNIDSTCAYVAGNFIHLSQGLSTSIANKNSWTNRYVENLTTLTGTNNSNNYYIVSTERNTNQNKYHILQNSSFYQWSSDYGVTFTKKTLSTTVPMTFSDSGTYVISCFQTTGSPLTSVVVHTSNNSGQSFFTRVVNPNGKFLINASISPNDQYQILSSVVTTGYVDIFYSLDYGSTFNGELVGPMSNITTNINWGCWVDNNKEMYVVCSEGGQIRVFTLFPRTTTTPFTSNSVWAIGLSKYSSTPATSNACVVGLNSSNQVTIWNSIGNGFLGSFSSNSTTSLFAEWYSTPGIQFRNAKIAMDPSKQYQVMVIIFSTTVISLWNSNNGNVNSWQRSTTFPTYITTISNISFNYNFSQILLAGGYSYTYNGQSRTDPVTFFSYDYGQNWSTFTDINPYSSFLFTNFYASKSVTNKSYFNVNDLNLNNVMTVSDNGFTLNRDLRVNNHDMYVLGGTLTVGSNNGSSLLNDYTCNVDGTVSARNIVLLSDERFKTIISTIQGLDAYEKLMKLEIVRYYFHKESKQCIGMIAQKVQDVINEAVDIRSSTIIVDNVAIPVDSVYSLNYTTILGYLIAAFQQIQQNLLQLEQTIESNL